MLGWCGVGMVTLTYDIWAIRTKRKTMSTVAREHPCFAGCLLAVLGVHLLA